MIDSIENVRSAFEKLGGLSVPIVHIAGSKGKGTTATLLATIVQNNGTKVGLFTSPALLHDEESIQVDGAEISSEDLDRLKEKVIAVDKTLTEFEVLTLAALSFFEEQACELVILECGWGGRFDATNIVDKKALTILTHVELEHTEVLGKTVSEITRNKLGIYRPGVPLLTVADQAPEVFLEMENEGIVPLLAPSYELGHHHPESVGLAVMAADLLGFFFDSVIQEALKNLVIPGRFEFVSFGAHTLLLEGAHTFDSLSYFLLKLQEFQREHLLPEPFFAIHILKDKPQELIELFPHQRTVWVPLQEERAGEKPQSLSGAQVKDIFGDLLREKVPQFWVFVGSFRLVAEVKRSLKNLT
jgi:dihydrofolate synthase/folylpolyglutamate synthase